MDERRIAAMCEPDAENPITNFDLHRLRAELTRLRAENEALRADKAMLDWIIGKFCLVGVESLPRSILGSRETISAAMESENTAVCER